VNRIGRLLWTALAGQAVGTVLGLRSFPVRAGLGFVLLAALLLALRRSAGAIVCGTLLVGFSLGLVDAHMRGSEVGPLERLAKDVPRCTFTGEVLERAGGLGTLAKVRSLGCEGFRPITDPGVVVMEDSADAGSTFETDGLLVPLGSGGFADARRRLGAGAVLQTGDIDFAPPRGSTMQMAAGMRAGMRRAVSDLDPIDGALLRGLTIGDTEGFDDETDEMFRRAGLSHLVAVSGSNVAIVLGVFVLLARPLGLYLRLALASAGLLLYVLIVGPEPSVVRAGAMGGIGLFALATGSRAAPMNALALALVIVLAYRPALVHAVGLHMSAAATAGIVLWAERIASALHRIPRVVAVAAGVTVAAQVAVAPIVIGVFGQLSMTGPLANLLAAPAVAPATIAGLAAGVVASASPVAGAAGAHVAQPFAWWIAEVARGLGGGWAAAEVPSWVGWVLLIPVASLALVTIRRTRTLGQ
jgi:competence protein ComEC